jgi:mRNA interferase MazF
VSGIAFDPSVGGETRKTPRRSSSATTRPIRPAAGRAARVSLGGEARKACADQMATASKERLRSRLGQLSASDMALVERATRVQLGLAT